MFHCSLNTPPERPLFPGESPTGIRFALELPSMVQDPSFPSDDALPAWMCEAETQVILAANAAATTLVGFDEAELRGRRLETLLSPDQPATLVQRAFPAL